MMSLLDYGFSQYSSKNIFKKGQIIKQISIPEADINKINLLAKEDVSITNRVGYNPHKYNYYIKLKSFNFPIKKGDTIGILYIKYDSGVVKEIDLISDTDIKKAGFFKQYIGVIKNMLNGNII